MSSEEPGSAGRGPEPGSRRGVGKKPEDDGGRGFSRWFLRLIGCENTDEAVRDLDEEYVKRRRAGHPAVRVGAWRAGQLLAIVGYEIRDLRLRDRGSRLHPLVAGRLAVRSVRRAPGVPIAAALTLGLGFGAAAAIYGVYSGFGGPLPVPDGDGVRWVRVLDERGRRIALPGAELAALQSGTGVFEQLGGYAQETVTVRYGEQSATRVSSARMTPELFELLGVDPTHGRLLTAGDAEAVVVSHALWSGYLGSADDVIGSSVRIDGIEWVVVGVMPEGHRFPFNEDLWRLLETNGATDVEPAGRLRAGISADRAAAEVESILEARRSDAGAEQPGVRVAVPGFTEQRGESGENAALATVLALVVALVLVSCSNVSNLLFSRALSRADLLAVHAAIGAGPAQVAVQMFLEALLIAFAGAVVGLGLAVAAIGYIESTLNGHWGYYWMEVRFDAAVVLFTLGLAVLTGLVSGVMPALRLWRSDLADALRADAAGVVGAGPRRLSTVLLNGQVAFSCFALVIAMLLAGALLRSQVADGFPAEQVYVSGLALDGTAYEQAERRRWFRGSLLAGLRAEREVTVVAFTDSLPGVNARPSALEVEGAAVGPDARPRRTPVVVASAPFFELFGLRPLAGRLFEDAEPDSGAGVAVVSDSFVREHLDGADPLGQRLRLPAATGEDWVRIIGVVADLPVYAVEDRRALARVYLPFQRSEPRSPYLLYRGTDGAVRSLGAAVVRVDPDVAVTGVFGSAGGAPVADALAYVRRLFQTTGVLALLGGIGAAAVATIGLYGALGFEIQRRVPEMGVRMAMGAAGRDIVLHTARSGLLRVAPGLLTGFLMAAGIGPLLGYLLGRMDPLDPLIHLGVFAGYLLVTIAAAVVPGRRAARLDPVAVLRSG